MSPESPGSGRTKRWRSHLTGAILGEPRIRRLTVTHALGDVADGLVNISLVGSLFFSVSLEASRDRILLYLVLAVAPLAVVVPAVAPILERTRAGYRSLVVGSFVTRAVAAAILTGSLKSPTLYPLVFVVLLSRRTYALARTALVPHLILEPDQLANASGYLSRVGTVTGGVGATIGGAAIALSVVELAPLLAAVGYVAAAVAAHRIPNLATENEVHASTFRTGVPHGVRHAGIAVCGMRASSGALTYLLALAIKRGGTGSWIFVVALAAAGIGSYLGTVITGGLLRRLGADQVVAFLLLVPGSVTLLSVLAAGNFSIVAIALSIGLGNSVATRTMDTLYGHVPGIARGRAISYNELRFQLSNFAGAVLAVMLNPTPKLGFVAVSAVLLLSGASYASQRKLRLRRGAGVLLLSRGQYSPTTLLPRTLLDEATLQGEQGADGLAIVTAQAAVRSAVAQGAIVPTDRWRELQALGDAVLAGAPATAGLVDEMLAAAREAISQLEASTAITLRSGR